MTRRPRGINITSGNNDAIKFSNSSEFDGLRKIHEF